MNLLPPPASPAPSQADERKHLTVVLTKLHRWHQILTAIYLPLVVGLMATSCVWSYIAATESKYDNVNDQWQACLVYPNFATIPLEPIIATQSAYAKGNVTQLVGTMYTCAGMTANAQICENATACATTIQDQCILNTALNFKFPTPASVDNIKMPTGQLLASLSYMGLQTTIFTMVSHGALNRALRHPSWLPATIAFLIWGLVAVLTYYTINPILPVPAKTNSTLIIMFMYFKKSVFDDMNDGHNDCQQAYEYVWLYLSMIICIIAIQIGSIYIAIKAEITRLFTPNRKMQQPLHGTLPPVIICGFIMAFYLVVVLAKIIGSANMINSIRDVDVTIEEAAAKRMKLWFDDSFYPFQQGSLDLNSLLFIATFMGIIRGYSRQSVSAFRMSAGMAFVFCVVSYPGLIGAFQFYDYNNFADDDDCQNYFQDPATTAIFGYPDDDQAKLYCSSFRLSIAGTVSLVFFMHVMMVLSAMTYTDNQHRSSAIFEPLDPSHIAVSNTMVQSPHHKELEKEENF